VTSVEADELTAAHNCIGQREAELAMTGDACELCDERAVVPIHLSDNGIGSVPAAIPPAPPCPGREVKWPSVAPSPPPPAPHWSTARSTHGRREQK
jgi:hypothetical protein